MNANHRILVVEDDATLNKAYKTLLDQAGYDVQVAFDGKQALEKAAEKEPELIFLDLRMPVLDGVGFLREYKPKENHPDVTIIIFSNYDMQKEVDEAYKLGADRYVLKAWASPKELLHIVRDTLEEKQSLKS